MLSFLYVYSDHSILECYNLFSGVELSMRSFFVIIEKPLRLLKFFLHDFNDYDKNLVLPQIPTYNKLEQINNYLVYAQKRC